MNYLIAIALSFALYWVYRFFTAQGREAVKTDANGIYSEINNEQKIRRQWLTSFFAYTSIWVIQNCIVLLGGDLFEGVAQKLGFGSDILFGILVICIVTASWCGITYYFSYKKKGTKWLYWTIGILVGREILNVIRGEWVGTSELNVFAWATILAALAVETWFWVNCLRLYGCNIALKRQKTKEKQLNQA